MIFILGPTATGKTRIAALAAHDINAEIISADSRQVYQKMDIGTGKDIGDYVVKGFSVPVHLIDIVKAGFKYSIYDFQNDFRKAQKEITERGKKVIVCGGSGLHLETALGLYTLEEAPEDQQFRHEASTMSHDELVQILVKLTKLHNTTDITDRNRLIRAIEVAKASNFVNKTEDTEQKISKANKNLIFGIKMPREIIRQRISTRLQLRLNEGMIDEVEGLLKNDLKPEDIIYYGLEYKYITLYLIGEIDYNQMYEKLNTAINQFAKRQMTWFRRMEKKGIKIQWLDGMNEPEKIALQITDIVGRTNYIS